jgi:hypothetical protein
VRGIATFDDLSIAEAVGETRLTAQRDSSITEAVSHSFSVVAHLPSESRIAPAFTAIARPTGQIPECGTPLFFGDGRRLAVLGQKQASVYTIDGARVASRPLALRGATRLVRRNDRLIFLADWQGGVQGLRHDGEGFEIRFAEANRKFAIPADADLIGDNIYIGFWNGSLYRISSDGSYELFLREPEGIQVLGASGDRVFTCDFSGNLRTYRNRRLLNTVALDQPSSDSSSGQSLIWTLKETPEALIAVGNKQLYHISNDGSQVYGFDLPLGDIESVYELSALPVVMDTEGKGIRFDASLIITSSVLTQPGAYPISADDGGKYCIFRNPNGTCTLLKNERIVFSTAAGELAVSPDGEHFALVQEDGIGIYSKEEFFKLVESQSIDGPSS